MALTLSTNTNIATQYRRYFSKELLEHAINSLHLADFAKKAALPTKEGSKTMRFFRPNEADATQVQTLTEGTAINVFRDVSYTHIDVDLIQFGEASRISDVATWTALFDLLKQSIQTQGEDCALHMDTIIRNVLVHPTTGLTKRYAQGLPNFAALVSATVAAGKLIATDLLDACTRLAVNKAPRINGEYVAIAPPQVTRDLKNDPDWLEASKYSDVKKLYKGEAGTWQGIRVVEATNPFLEQGTEGTYNGTINANTIYSTIITGRDAYGCPELSGQSPLSPKTILITKEDHSNPLNQYITVGWKAFWNAVVLNQNFGITLRTKSAFTA